MGYTDESKRKDNKMDKIYRYINGADNFDVSTKRYILVNSRDIPLNSFHGNGGWSMRDVFPCNWNCHSAFYTEEEAQDHLQYMKNECIKQKERWGNWFNKAWNYVNKFKVKELVYIEY